MSADEPLAASHFDGLSTRPRPARLSVKGSELVITHDDGTPERRVALSAVSWPERHRHGARVAHIAAAAGGGSVQCDDGPAWDAFALRALGSSPSWVVRAQQSWHATAAAVVLLLVVVGAGYLWGVPWLARGIVAVMPQTVDQSLGQIALDSVGARWLKPSKVSPEERKRIEARFTRMVELAFPDAAQRPAYSLRFHASSIGPNAFALPGGIIVLTDELLHLLQGSEDTVLGVLAHELGHVRDRHGMRMLVQVSLISAATSVALGDFSSVLASVPVLMGQLAYSRDAEREADAESVRMMRAAGLSPAVMVGFFERIGRWRTSDEGKRSGASFDLGIAFSSHPADAERIAFFRAGGR